MTTTSGAAPSRFMRAVTYNPMHLCGMRGEEVSSEFGNVGAVLLQGTGRRKMADEPYRVFRHSRHYELSFGFSRSSNKSCGT
eukprot:6720686-Pyramimonas_sp.AAC.1